MIHNLDRSGYIGASDTKFVVGNWKTRTFDEWWAIKTGQIKPNILTSRAIEVGNAYEKRILDYIKEILRVDEMEYDKQIIIEDLKLRVNLDGNDANNIFEIKTYFNFNHNGYWIPTKAYEQQVRVQMFATKLKGFIYAYQVTNDEYQYDDCEINKERLSCFEINQDETWLNEVYLPRLKTLANCMKENIYPNEELLHR